MFRRGTRGRGDPVHRAQRPPGEDPTEDGGEGDDRAKRDQGVQQQVRQGEVTLVLRAELLLRDEMHSTRRALLGWALGCSARQCATMLAGRSAERLAGSVRPFAPPRCS